MKNIKSILVVVCIVLSACTNTDNKSVEWEIHIDGVGEIILGESTQDIKTVLGDKYSMSIDQEFGFDILDSKKEVLLKVATIDDKIGVVEVYSNEFQTEEGIRVGMTLKELKEICEDCEPQMDIMNGAVFVAPEKYKISGQMWLIYFATKSYSPVWVFKKIPHGGNFIYQSIGKPNKNARAEFIRIYKN